MYRDDAYIHPPMGGQVLNGDLQFAMNLGWRLAAVFKSQAPSSFLVSYEAERRPIG
ncbi:FAD-dependent monooxygenase [Martelella limonii]|uniref:FAD-dependent monooxygenase n=1 Tax=Martelella limonii TaxID=1647649 RepID=UPI001580152E